MENDILAYAKGLAETVGRATPVEGMRRKQIRPTWTVRGPIVDGKIREGEPKEFHDSISAFVYAVNSYPDIGMSNSRRLRPYTWDQTDEVAIYGKTRPIIALEDGTTVEAPHKPILDTRIENIDLTNVLMVIKHNAWPYGAAIHGVFHVPAPPIKNKTGKYILTDIKTEDVKTYHNFEEVITKIKSIIGVATNGTIFSYLVTDLYEEYRLSETGHSVPKTIEEQKAAGIKTFVYDSRVVLTI